jgi:hypothetical protein
MAAAPPGSTTPSSPPPRPRDARAAQREADLQHLREVLPALLPGATDIEVPAFLPGGAPDLATAAVTFRDSAGPGYFTLSVGGPAGSAVGMKPAAGICDPHKPPLRCEKIPQPDGSTVLLWESGLSGLSGRNVAQVDEFDAIHYRTDGSTVNIVNSDFISTMLAQRFDFKDANGGFKNSRGFR